MKFLLPVALLATAAAAQTTATCAAQNIVDSCLGTTKPAADDCSPSDYDCLCKAWTTILGCYDNCPNSADRTGVVNTKQAYCQYVTTSSAAAAATTTAATGGSATEAATTGASTGTGTRTSSTAAATSTNSGADLAMNAGGVLAAVAGVVVAML